MWPDGRCGQHTVAGSWTKSSRQQQPKQVIWVEMLLSVKLHACALSSYKKYASTSVYVAQNTSTVD